MHQMVEKNSHNQKQLWEDGIKLKPWILKRMEQDWEKIFFGLQNMGITTRNTTMNCWGTGIKKNIKVEPMMKNNLEDLGERHLTDDKSFLRQTSKRNWEYLPKNKKSQVRSWKKAPWVRAHSRETPLKWFKRENAPVKLNGLNEITPRNRLNRSWMTRRAFWDILSTPEQMNSEEVGD